MIIRTEAVPLRAIEYGETSLIVTLYTRELGKLTVIAKGARSPRSRFGSTLQPMSYVQAVFYYKSGRDIHTLKEATHVLPFNRLRSDLGRISAGLRIVELVNSVMHDSDHNAPAFNLLMMVLKTLDEQPNASSQLLHYFQLKLAGILGFAPGIDRAEVEHVGDEGGVLRLDTGAILPSVDAGIPARKASRPALRAFAVFARCDIETIVRFRPDVDACREAGTLVEAFLQYHFSDHYPVRAGRVASQLGLS